MLQIIRIVLMDFMTKLTSHDVHGRTNVAKGRIAGSDAERSVLKCRTTIFLRPIVQTVLSIFALKPIPSCNMQAKP